MSLVFKWVMKGAGTGIKMNHCFSYGNTAVIGVISAVRLHLGLVILSNH